MKSKMLLTVLTSLTLPALMFVAGCGSESADPPSAPAGGTATAGGSGTAGVPATGGVSGMPATGGVSGMPATGGVSGMPATGGVSGMPATGGVSGMPNGTVCDAPTTIFQVDGDQGCNGAICHTAANMADYPPDLVSPDPGPRLKDVVSTSQGCAGRKYIDSANIENSLLLTKLVSPPICGAAAMPFAKPALLPQDKIDCIRSWITSIAQQP